VGRVRCGAMVIRATRRQAITFGLGTMASALVGCSSSGSTGGKPLVAASIFPLYDIARRVAGDRLEVALVLPPGKSEHGFDPSPKEMAAVAKAKLGISVGLEMDTWLEKIVKGAAGVDVKMLQLGPSLDPRKMTAREVGIVHEKHDGHDHDHDHDKKDAPDKKDVHEGHAHEKERNHGDKPTPDGHAHGALDPHVWLDPTRMKKALPLLVDAFKALDAAGADAFSSRSAEVDKALDALHAELEARSKRWTKKTIVTFHGSMGYFAERYGIKIAAVVEPFPGKEPTAKYIQEVIEVIGETKAAALFSEPQLDKRPAEVIAEQAKVPLGELDPVGGTSGADTYEKLLSKIADAFDKTLS